MHPSPFTAVMEGLCFRPSIRLCVRRRERQIFHYAALGDKDEMIRF